MGEALKGEMKIFTYIILLISVIIIPLGGLAQQEDAGIKPVLSTEPAVEEKKESTVTAVYGVTADDYLPTIEEARRHLRPNVRRSGSRPGFDLPDAFYFIGGPIFLLILLRVLIIFLNGFEEKRKEEQRATASENARSK